MRRKNTKRLEKGKYWVCEEPLESVVDIDIDGERESFRRASCRLVSICQQNSPAPLPLSSQCQTVYLKGMITWSSLSSTEVPESLVSPRLILLTPASVDDATYLVTYLALTRLIVLLSMVCSVNRDFPSHCPLGRPQDPFYLKLRVQGRKLRFLRFYCFHHIVSTPGCLCHWIFPQS